MVTCSPLGEAVVIHSKFARVRLTNFSFLLTSLDQMFGKFNICKESDAAYSREMSCEGRQLEPPVMALQCQQMNILFIWFVCVDSLGLSQEFFSHVGICWGCTSTKQLLRDTT